tara:strand:- start:1442 stop:3079 length:1638 start_codon:yes stop_codon:yes gene_type:complete
VKIVEPLLSEVKKVFNEYDIFEEIDFKISNIENFDYQINNLVKHQNHNEIDQILKKINLLLDNLEIVENFEITKKYFLNIKINLNNCEKFLSNIESNFLSSVSKKIIIDYGGPNIGKPLHVGHLRSLNIGRSLKELNKLIGNKVTTDIHLGDWGMPVAQIISFCEQENIDIKNLNADMLINIYPKASTLYLESKDFQKLAKKKNKELNNQEKKALTQWSYLRKISIDSIKETLIILNHDFDLWNGESDVNELIEPMIESLKKDSKVELDDGALVSTQDTDPKILIAKSDGSYLYLTTDLGTILSRLNKNDFDIALYVVDSRQKLHFKQLFQTVEYFDFPKRDYKHIDFGTINNMDGKPFKTREGGTEKLISLYEQTYEYIKNINNELEENTLHKLTNTVLTYSDLLTNRKTDYKFNLEKFTNISGKTGIYVQYAQVRAKKIITNSNIDLDSSKLVVSNTSERNLIIALLNFELSIKQSIRFSEPHHLADYLYEICNLFNIFYQEENILTLKDADSKKSKLLLIKYFLETTEIVFKCLGIETVDEM